jgi:predicted ester cyclase
VRHVVRGTQRGEFLGVPATGRVVTFQAVDIFRLTGNKIVEQWVVIDALGLLQQLGAIPNPG